MTALLSIGAASLIGVFFGLAVYAILDFVFARPDRVEEIRDAAEQNKLVALPRQTPYDWRNDA